MISWIVVLPFLSALLMALVYLSNTSESDMLFLQLWE